MSILPSFEELRQRLVRLLRLAKALHGDVHDRPARRELRLIAGQIQSAIHGLDHEADDEACWVAVRLLAAITDRLDELQFGVEREAPGESPHGRDGATAAEPTPLRVRGAGATSG